MNKTKFFFSFLLICLGSYFSWIYYNTPAFIKSPNGLEERIVFLDRHGLPIRAYSPGESFEWVSLRDVPKDQLALLVLAEDKNFYSHSGIDVNGVIRSLWLNFKSLSVVSGASTIDQQVFRLSHQTPRTLSGKLQTMIGAWKINSRYSKDEILQHYINMLPYAQRLTGIKRASEVLFGKELQLLSLSEMAALAILPRSPGLLTKNSFAQVLSKRKNQLLALFNIPADQLVLEEKVQIQIKKDFTGWNNYHLVSKLLKKPDLSRFIENGKVHTTLDSYLQFEVSQLLHSQLVELKHLNVTHGAVAVLENATGDILSYVGSQQIEDSSSGYIDALEVKRQPGSTLKPFTYALALQSGKTLGDILADIPTFYKTGLGQFVPRNYDLSFSGPRLMREALANSLNLPAVALAEELGVNELYQFYKGMGLELPADASQYGVGLTLGNVEITPLNLLEVYSAFPNKGQRSRVRYLQKEEALQLPTPLNADSAFLISDVLKDPLARREEFGERNPFNLPFEFSVKTGTSTDFRDNWSVGFNRKYTVVVWVGNMDQKPMKKVSGITGAGPVLSKVARYLMRNQFLAKESVPENIQKHQVCALSGKTAGPLCSHLKTELFLQGTKTADICTFHQEISVQDCHELGDIKKVGIILLPEKYKPFIDQNSSWSIENQVSRICTQQAPLIAQVHSIESEKVAIVRPLPGSIFAIDPHIPKTFQKLKLELNHFSDVKHVLWKKDGSALKGESSTLDWAMEKGDHSFEAEIEFVNGKVEKTESLSVTVL
jgi:penicillin-binding protein 1C